MSENTIKVNDDVKEKKYSNTFKISYTDTEFLIDFGQLDDEKNEITVVSKVVIPTDVVKHLIARLFIGAQEYQEKFKTDIGFGKINESETK
jgi:hypothetical protein